MKTRKKPTQDQIDEVARALWWAVRFMDTPSRCGLVVTEDTVTGEHKTESPFQWFKRALKPFGYDWDDELLQYSHAPKYQKKQMEQDPKFAAKLAKARAAIAKAK